MFTSEELIKHGYLQKQLMNHRVVYVKDDFVATLNPDDTLTFVSGDLHTETLGTAHNWDEVYFIEKTYYTHKLLMAEDKVARLKKILKKYA